MKICRLQLTMQIKSFLLLSCPHSLWNITILALTFFMQRHISIFFFGNRFGLFAKSLIGLAINGATLSILISFNMSISHIFTWSMFFLLGIVEIFSKFKLISNYKNKKFSLLKFDLVFVSFLIFIIIQIYSFNTRNFRLVNAHWSYYFGLPAEILKGTYTNRVKIFDNFPIEYPKYHFFNSSELAIMMRPLGKVVFADYALAKIVLLSAFAALAIEILTKKVNFKKTLVAFVLFVLLGFTALSPNLFWAFNSSNYSVIAYFIFFFISVLRKNILEQIIWLSIFSMTTVRSVVPSIVLLIYIVLKLLRNTPRDKLLKYINLKSTIILTILIVNWLVIFFSGVSTTSSTLELIRKQLEIPYQNLVNPGWLTIMSSGVFGSFNNSITWCSLWFLTVIVLVNSSKNTIGRHSIPVIGVSFLILLTFILRHYEISKSVQISSVILNFVVPIFAVLILDTQYARVYVVIFILTSLFEILILDGGQSIPNWALIEWLWLLLLVYQLRILNFNSVKWVNTFFVLALTVNLCYSPIKINEWFQANQNDDTTHVILDDKITFTGADSCKLDDMTQLLNSLAGNRSYYDKSKSDRYSVTKIFINDLDSYETSNNCD